jgi:hypothetical protein
MGFRPLCARFSEETHRGSHAPSPPVLIDCTIIFLPMSGAEVKVSSKHEQQLWLSLCPASPMVIAREMRIESALT